ncbi:ATP-dependent RNA helicase DbpA [Alteromonas sp. 76-1]|uniref:ATP-dependent RNA helicase DbpA n=1 Tax=Alteromonas sp. 76-1 TaxID=2358187 RepID=UPI000FD18439|nr:ATP-dependent RNA helicase DbpA [Alteromonas sp. 76-1]VEL98725.1 ATP-dependent RNA helicase DbpA [Alteromonas sp. 76-1]
MTIETIKQLEINPAITKALDAQGIFTLSPIQAQSLPHALAGSDVIGQAQTGSGKTLCFVIPALEKIDPTLFATQVLVLCPTRELADQVAVQYRNAAKQIGNIKVMTICGGQPMGPQIQSLKHGAHVVVGTPGRVMEHVEKRRLMLKDVRLRVLDEADRMLDMGFEDDLKVIFSPMKKGVQTLLFSATYTEEIERIADQYLTEPVICKVESDESNKPSITQIGYNILPHTRIQTLKAILTDSQPKTAIVFCNRRVQVTEVVASLLEDGFSAAGLQGEMEQYERTAVLNQFASDALQVLVATDVAARGLDIDDIPCVINYTVSEEPETHIHRIGRTARAGAEGTAITLVGDEEEHFLRKIEVLQGTDIPLKGAQGLRFHKNRIIEPEFSCISLSAGKKQKLRPGDLVGALTKDAGIPGDDVGKIAVQNSQSFIAVKLRSVKRAMNHFREGKIKGKRVRARKL